MRELSHESFAVSIPLEPIWDSAEAARYLRIHPRTLTRMAKRHEIPAIHLGRLWRFRKNDLDSWMQRQLVSIPSSVPVRVHEVKETS